MPDLAKGTLDELEEWLEECDLVLHAHPTRDGWYVVFYATDDAAIRATAEGPTLAGAVARARALWDGTAPKLS